MAVLSHIHYADWRRNQKARGRFSPFTRATSGSVCQHHVITWLKPAASARCDRHLPRWTALPSKRKHFKASQHIDSLQYFYANTNVSSKLYRTVTLSIKQSSSPLLLIHNFILWLTQDLLSVSQKNDVCRIISYSKPWITHKKICIRF